MLLCIVVILVLLTAINCQLVFIARCLNRIDKHQRELLDKLLKRKPTQAATVTDPFKLANTHTTQKSSSDGIVIRKTPEQIRNENYKKIKEGQKYGFIE